MEIDGNENVQIKGDGNHIGDNHFNNSDSNKHLRDPKDSPEITYRNPNIDFIWVAISILIFIGAPAVGIGYLNAFIVSLIVSILGYFAIASIFPSSIMSVYGDKFEIGFEPVFHYNEIRYYKCQGNTFTYIFHDSDKEKKINFYSEKGPKYMFHKINEYVHYHNLIMK